MNIVIDHLVVAAGNLDEGTEDVSRRLGSTPIGGGRHSAMGTHNRVLKLGDGLYLEVIAVDPKAPAPAWPRWFALDDPFQQRRLARRPRLVAWVARTDDVDVQAGTVYDRPATVRPMQRDRLRWRFAFTADGSVPGDGALPYLIQWTGASHPTEGMPASGCRLAGLEAFHTDQQLTKRLQQCSNADPRIRVETVPAGATAGIRASIETQAGVVILD